MCGGVGQGMEDIPGGAAGRSWRRLHTALEGDVEGLGSPRPRRGGRSQGELRGSWGVELRVRRGSRHHGGGGDG